MKNLHPALYLLIGFILADTACENLLIQAFHTQAGLTQTFLIVGYMIVTIFISPLQAGFSDFYCRKKSVIISLVFSLLSLILVFLYLTNYFKFFGVFFLIILFKGFLGNTTPISWAAVADTQSKELRFSLGLATAPYALAYLILNVFDNSFSVRQSNFSVIIAYIVLVVMCIFLFRDLRDDKRSHKTDNMSFYKKLCEEISFLIEDLKDIRITSGLLAFLCWSISLYAVLVLLVDFETPFHKTASIMMYGYLVGVVILKFLKRAKDNFVIHLGYFVSVIPFMLYFILFFMFGNTSTLLAVCYFFYGMGNAYLSPTMLTILSKEKHIHEQGKIFGLVESADSLGFLVGTIAILVYQVLKINIFFMILFSAIVFLLSWIPFSINKKLRKQSAS